MPTIRTSTASAFLRGSRSRPEEEYNITLNLLKVNMNQTLTDEQFTLEQPAGADVVHLDRPQSSLVVPVIQGPQQQ